MCISPRGAWIDTDDLNGDKNELHYRKEENGSIALGRRFAAKAIELANNKSQSKQALALEITQRTASVSRVTLPPGNAVADS